MEKTYIAIDLKSFYASVECHERDLDPLTTRLVVADPTRTGKTICLAVSPELKKYGIPGRPRLFEVEQKAKQFHIDYIVAPPRMKLYMDYSTHIFGIYLRYIAPEDMHVYSVDECFMDVTGYLNTYHMTAAATSSGRPKRPTGINCFSSSCGRSLVISVSMNPGATAFTVTPRAATSCAKAFVAPINAAFAAL